MRGLRSCPEALNTWGCRAGKGIQGREAGTEGGLPGSRGHSSPQGSGAGRRKPSGSEGTVRTQPKREGLPRMHTGQRAWLRDRSRVPVLSGHRENEAPSGGSARLQEDPDRVARSRPFAPKDGDAGVGAPAPCLPSTGTQDSVRKRGARSQAQRKPGQVSEHGGEGNLWSRGDLESQREAGD